MMNQPASTRQRDVVILGAGLAGSSLAAVLGQLGWDVVVLERQHFPRHKVCGEFLSPEAQASLRAMGLYPVVAALSPARLSQARLVSRTGLTAQTPLPGQAWGLSRFALDAALAAAAQQAGVELHTGATAISVSQAGKGFAVTMRSRPGTTIILARAVIAACGRYTLPGLPPRPAAGQRPTYIGVKRHYEGIVMPAQVELFFFPGGYAGVSPIEGGRVNLCLLASQAALARAGKSGSAILDRVAAWHPALARRLADGRALPETEVAVAPVDPNRPATPWEGMACLGDTAVMIPPLCGDGMAMALRSAEICAPLAHDFLRGHLSWAGWAATYPARWHAEFDRPVRVGRLLQTILNRPLLSDAFIGLGRLVPALTAALVRATRGPDLRP